MNRKVMNTESEGGCIFKVSLTYKVSLTVREHHLETSEALCPQPQIKIHIEDNIGFGNINMWENMNGRGTKVLGCNTFSL
jgi:hypothetical protein